jgi:hypothetical protein
VSRFVAGHVAKERLHVWVVHLASQFGVEHATRELGSDRADQEVGEFLVELGIELGVVTIHIRRPLEVVDVVITLELGHQRIPLRADVVHRDPIDGIRIGCVEPRRNKGLGHCHAG